MLPSWDLVKEIIITALVMVPSVYAGVALALFEANKRGYFRVVVNVPAKDVPTIDLTPILDDIDTAVAKQVTAEAPV